MFDCILSKIKCKHTISVKKVDQISQVTDLAPVFQMCSLMLPLPLLKNQLCFPYLQQGLAANAQCVRMCPPLTTKNFNSYKPLLALGQ